MLDTEGIESHLKETMKIRSFVSLAYDNETKTTRRIIVFDKFFLKLKQWRLKISRY